MKGFLAEAAAVDLPRLRTKIALVFFRLVPNLYVFKPLKVLCLRAAGARAPLGGVYVKSPFAVEFGRNLSIGAGTFVNSGVFIENAAPVSIGRRCQIGPRCVFTTTNHRGAAEEALPVAVGDDVWIGAGVVVAPGAVIGDGITVAAGAVVVGELEGGSLWGGVPARRLR